MFDKSENSIHVIRLIYRPLFYLSSVRKIYFICLTTAKPEAFVWVDYKILLKLPPLTLYCWIRPWCHITWKAKTAKYRWIYFLIHTCSTKYKQCGLINSYYYVTLPYPLTRRSNNSHQVLTTSLLLYFRAVILKLSQLAAH